MALRGRILSIMSALLMFPTIGLVWPGQVGLFGYVLRWKQWEYQHTSIYVTFGVN